MIRKAYLDFMYWRSRAICNFAIGNRRKYKGAAKIWDAIDAQVVRRSRLEKLTFFAAASLIDDPVLISLIDRSIHRKSYGPMSVVGVMDATIAAVVMYFVIIHDMYDGYLSDSEQIDPATGYITQRTVERTEVHTGAPVQP